MVKFSSYIKLNVGMVNEWMKAWPRKSTDTVAYFYSSEVMRGWGSAKPFLLNFFAMGLTLGRRGAIGFTTCWTTEPRWF